jgi:hypothetical protein
VRGGAKGGKKEEQRRYPVRWLFAAGPRMYLGHPPSKRAPRKRWGLLLAVRVTPRRATTARKAVGREARINVRVEKPRVIGRRRASMPPRLNLALIDDIEPPPHHLRDPAAIPPRPHHPTDPPKARGRPPLPAKGIQTAQTDGKDKSAGSRARPDVN